SPLTYQNAPENMWKQIKLQTHKPRVLGILREVTAWREKEAQRRDVPRGRVLRDEACAEIAYHPPTTLEDLKKIRNISKSLTEDPQRYTPLLEAVKHGMNVSESDCPRYSKRPDLPAGLGPTVEL